MSLTQGFTKFQLDRKLIRKAQGYDITIDVISQTCKRENLSVSPKWCATSV